MHTTSPNSPVDAAQSGDAIHATLFGEHKVWITPESATAGGAWQARDADGKPASWEPEIVHFFFTEMVGNGATFYLDIGANTGNFCLLPSLCPDLGCFAFEPNPGTVTLLKKNIALNGLNTSVQVYPVALSDTQGTATLKIPASGRDSGLACLGNPLRFRDWQEVSVPVTTLDHVLEKKAITRLDFIKIDTEGCELFVLRGGMRYIRKFMPSILLEFFSPNTRQFNYDKREVWELLHGWGYKCKILNRENAYFTPAAGRAAH